TPDIVGSIRLGLAFELKQRVHHTNIMRMEAHHLQTVRESLEQNPNPSSKRCSARCRWAWR
ncbi:MAG: hypothetical protein ACEQR8_10230, partial [Cypionkella sp.]